MNLSNFLDTINLVRGISYQVLAWRDDQSSRFLHSSVDFKTEADFRAHRLFCEGLSIYFPDIPIISEESCPSSYIRPNNYWLIDPIDGTSSWYHGFDGFVCQAAYFHEFKPIFGVISAPALNTVWYGMNGHGSFKNGKKLPLLVSSSRRIIIDNTPEPHGITAELYPYLHPTGYLESGSMGLKAVLVADGTADLFVKDVVVRDWDLAPASVILKEVNGVLIQADGNDYSFSGSFEKTTGFVIARDEKLSGEVISFFASTNI
jgi:3'(2'), 5'-bisphosphate nucleotidase